LSGEIKMITPQPKFKKGDIVLLMSDDEVIGTILNSRFASYHMMARPVKIVEEFRYEILIDNSVKYFFESDLKRIE